MELKFGYGTTTGVKQGSSNRTFMELKSQSYTELRRYMEF